MTTARLLRRKAYGLDQSGEVIDGQPLNIEDTANPSTNNETPHNPANEVRDFEAEEDFPELRPEVKRLRSQIP
jgi:hypothetical protein